MLKYISRKRLTKKRKLHVNVKIKEEKKDNKISWSILLKIITVVTHLNS